MAKSVVGRRAANLIMGPALFVVFTVFLPAGVFTTLAQRAAVATVVWMAYWWITGPVDNAVTGFVPIVVNALFSVVDMDKLIANYSDETILLLIGACILSVSWGEVGLDKRIASYFLALIGTSLTNQIVFWFILCTLVSSVLPNAVVCAVITPIAVSMLKYVGIDDISKSEAGSLILLTIVWAIGVGGLATPLGGAMDLVIINYIQKLTGKEYLYWDWVVRFAPVMLVLVASNLAYLLAVKPKGGDLAGSKEYFIGLRKSMGKMDRNEVSCLVLFIAATVLAFTRNLYSSFLPNLKPAYVFITCAIISFFLRRPDGTRVMVWSDVQKKITWGLFFVFGGGLALGTLISKSGASKALGTLFAAMGLKGGFLTVLAVMFIVMLISGITSNTAAAAVCVPIIISVTSGMGLNPIPYIYTAAIGVNLAYVFPTSIRAIPVGYGLSPKYMFKKGIALWAITCILMSVTAWALISFWPAFSLA